MNLTDSSFHFSFSEAVIIKENLDAEIGTVNAVAHDAPPKVSISKNGNKILFDFDIPVGEDVIVDKTLNDSSPNLVENRAIKKYVDNLFRSSITPKVEMYSTDTDCILIPNFLYVFPEMSSLTISLDEPQDISIVNDYKFRFISGETATVLTLPSSIIGEITVEPNTVYEVSIVDNYLLSQSWRLK